MKRQAGRLRANIKARFAWIVTVGNAGSQRVVDATAVMRMRIRDSLRTLTVTAAISLKVSSDDILFLIMTE